MAHATPENYHNSNATAVTTLDANQQIRSANATTLETNQKCNRASQAANATQKRYKKAPSYEINKKYKSVKGNIIKNQCVFTAKKNKKS